MPLSDYQYNLFFHLFKNDYYSKSTHLEIGCFDGSGTKKLAESYPDKHFICIDPFIEDGNTIENSLYNKGEKMELVKEKCLNNFKHIKNVSLYELTNKKFIENYNNDLIINENFNNINTINIDGAHDYNNVILDIDIACAFLRDKIGCIHFDDSFNKPGVSKAIISYFLINQHKNIINVKQSGPDSVLFNMDYTK